MSARLAKRNKVKSEESFANHLPLMLENLEERIAPAGIDPNGGGGSGGGGNNGGNNGGGGSGGTTITNIDSLTWKTVSFETPVLLTAGQGLSTDAGGQGAYLMYVTKGSALVYATDLNGNNKFDYNEITGIAAGNGMNLTSFVDIHGDIVTNLNADGTLSDLDPLTAGNDGRVLLNSSIDAITLRTITATESADYLSHMAVSSYSIYGNIYTGGSFGTTSGGLIIDTVGYSAMTTKFNSIGSDYYIGNELNPSVGYILTGTAASGQSFNFGVKPGTTGLHGLLGTYTAASGANGGDIIGVKVGDNAANSAGTFTAVQYQIGGLHAGDGGSGGRGGNISNVTLYGDVGGFFAIAGDGGSGASGGAGGSISNLVDLGSNNGQVIISTGDGGIGYNGAGGSGGTLSLGQFSTVGAVSILLGDGGDGTTAGGNGSGMATGTFTPQDPGTIIPIPLKIVTTYRDAGDIGTQKQVDFNGDGIGDMVYISQDPDIVVVRLGVEIDDPLLGTTYGFSSDSPIYYLAAPIYTDGNPASLVLGDFNNDGFTDIATVSSAAFTQDGLYVYLWNDSTQSFNLPLRSAIPYWNLAGGGVDYLGSGGTITNLSVGDYDHDGNLDLSFTAQYRATLQDQGKVTALVFMSGTGDGYFYANSNATGATYTAVPITTILAGQSKGWSETLLKSTAAVDGDFTSDFAIVASLGNNTFNSYIVDNSVYPDGAVTVTTADIEGKYRARTYNNTTDEVEFANATTTANIIDFSILDIDGDGNFDVLSLNDNGVLVAFQGAADTTFAQVDNNNGILLTSEFGVLGANAASLNSTFVGLVTGYFQDQSFNPDTSGAPQFGIYSIGTGDTGKIAFKQFAITGFEQTYATGSKAPEGDVYSLETALGESTDVVFTKPTEIDQDVIAFAAYQGFILDPSYTMGYVIGTPNSVKIDEASLQVSGQQATADSHIYPALLGSLSYPAIDLSITSFGFQAGNGGDSQLGVGGAGGSIGGGSLVVTASGTVTGSINLIIPRGTEDAGLSADFTYIAGDGGNGFTGGGAGGSVSGLVVSYTGGGDKLRSDIYLYSGDGGEASQGKGGAGGNISKFSVETLVIAVAGDGGYGLTGGDGGSILGNGLSRFDATDGEGLVTLVAGRGGDGLSAGGGGGSITNFKVGFNLYDRVIGALDYTAGDGGDAVAGRGGNGGSIINSSPIANLNYIGGAVFLTAGNGGNGLGGGNGGSITTFVNKPYAGTSATVVSIMAGNGGTGISLSGGIGGSLSDITASANGVLPSGELLFNRYLAGQGGESYGSAGGAGGSVSNFNVGATKTSVAVAAGAGGAGLTAGGLGGSIISGIATSAGSDSQLLVIAGDGGNASGYVSTTSLQNQLKSIGNVNGVGGNGGSISTFKATGATVSTNLIAGNGGGLLNYGVGITGAPVGKGGSVSNITLEGNAGDIRQNVAIKSYTTADMPTMADFVTDWLAINNGVFLTNAQGNVGVLVGAAGTVSINAFRSTNGVAAIGGVNGSVTTFAASNIMSMVAGSVDRISSILSLSGVSVAPGGALGSYKTNPVVHANTPYYYDEDGNVTQTASVGGKLMDGAIVAISKQASISGPRVFPK